MADVDVVAFAHRPGLDLARGVADALRLPGPLALSRPDRARRPSRRACGQRLLPRPVRAGRGAHLGSRRRLPVHHAAGRDRVAADPAGPDPQPRLAGRGVLRAHLVPRLSAQRRRGQDHGPCALRPRQARTRTGRPGQPDTGRAVPGQPGLVFLPPRGRLAVAPVPGPVRATAGARVGHHRVPRGPSLRRAGAAGGDGAAGRPHAAAAQRLP
jgi:hypothetical protein